MVLLRSLLKIRHFLKKASCFLSNAKCVMMIDFIKKQKLWYWEGKYLTERLQFLEFIIPQVSCLFIP